MPAAERTVDARWVSTADADRIGLQHVTCAFAQDGSRFVGVVVSDQTARYFGLSFEIEVNSVWHVTRYSLSMSDGRSLVLQSDGQGNWTDGRGASLPDLIGCIDADVSATPLTNTLPIRRLGLAVGERRRIRVVYIAVPALTACVVEQAYTCVEVDHLYQYEGIDGLSSTELKIDRHGLVLDYPSLFKRLF